MARVAGDDPPFRRRGPFLLSWAELSSAWGRLSNTGDSVCAVGAVQRAASRFDDAVADGIAHKLRHRMDLQLCHDARAVGFHRFARDAERGCDLFVSLALRQELK